jgi:hypothetical protein
MIKAKKVGCKCAPMDNKCSKTDSFLQPFAGMLIFMKVG